MFLMLMMMMMMMMMMLVVMVMMMVMVVVVVVVMMTVDRLSCRLLCPAWLDPIKTYQDFNKVNSSK